MKLTKEQLELAVKTFASVCDDKHASYGPLTVYMEDGKVDFSEEPAPKTAVDLFYTYDFKYEWYFAETDDREPFEELFREEAKFEFDEEDLQEVLDELFKE